MCSFNAGCCLPFAHYPFYHPFDYYPVYLIRILDQWWVQGPVLTRKASSSLSSMMSGSISQSIYLSFNRSDVQPRWRDFVNRQDDTFDFTGVLVVAVCTGRQTGQGSACSFCFSGGLVDLTHRGDANNTRRFATAVIPRLQIITACKDRSNLALTQQSYRYRANPYFYVESFWGLGWILWPGVNKTFYRWE